MWCDRCVTNLTGHHFTIRTHIKSLRCTLQNYITLYTKWMAINLEKRWALYKTNHSHEVGPELPSSSGRRTEKNKVQKPEGERGRGGERWAAVAALGEELGPPTWRPWRRPLGVSVWLCRHRATWPCARYWNSVLRCPHLWNWDKCANSKGC